MPIVQIDKAGELEFSGHFDAEKYRQASKCCAHVHAITSDERNDVIDGVRATWNEAGGKCLSSVTSDSFSKQVIGDICENRCSKISFCSTVAWIR